MSSIRGSGCDNLLSASSSIEPNCTGAMHHLNLLQLPLELLERITTYLTYDENSNVRQVCILFNTICGKRLNSGFSRAEKLHGKIQKEVKSNLPRRESERRNHALARHVDILSAVETRISLLNMTYSRYIELGLTCFVPGKVLDELFRVLLAIDLKTSPPRAHELLQELRDISSMAMEHFDEKIVPELKSRQRVFESKPLFSQRDVIEYEDNDSPVNHVCNLESCGGTETLNTSDGRFNADLFNHRLDNCSLRISALSVKLQIAMTKITKQETNLQKKSLLVNELKRKMIQQARRITELEQKSVDQTRRNTEFEQKFSDVMRELARVRGACGGVVEDEGGVGVDGAAGVKVRKVKRLQTTQVQVVSVADSDGSNNFFTDPLVHNPQLKKNTKKGARQVVLPDIPEEESSTEQKEKSGGKKQSERKRMPSSASASSSLLSNDTTSGAPVVAGSSSTQGETRKHATRREQAIKPRSLPSRKGKLTTSTAPTGKPNLTASSAASSNSDTISGNIASYSNDTTSACGDQIAVVAGSSGIEGGKRKRKAASENNPQAVKPKRRAVEKK